MAVKYIELKQAAEMLGVSTDELNNMRLAGEVYGVRDGSSWKFKADEIERVAEERGISLTGTGEAEDALDLDLDAEEVDDSPTAIGKGAEAAAPKDAGKAPAKPSSASDLGFELESGSDIRLVADQSGSGVDLVAGSSDDVLGGAGSGDLSLDSSDLDLIADVSPGKASKPGVEKAPAEKAPAAKAADSDVTIGESEEIALDEDDELVLEGVGSDITRGAGDTGINLTSPSDSGLNLEEEPLDLAGSSVSSLELPEDEDLLDLEDLEAEPEAAAPVQADEDFQLAPSAALQEDEEDSGSQVIALEDSSAFAAPAETALAGEEAVVGAPAEADELAGALEEKEAAPVTLPTVQLAAAQDIPYSIWNVLSLLAIVVILAITGMLMTDLVRNMWTWDQTFTASTPIMDVMVRMFGLQP